MSVHLKIENSREGIVATLSQRDAGGQLIGDPSVGIVASAAEAKQRAKTLARSLGLKAYGLIDKTKSAAGPGKPRKAIADRDGSGGVSSAEKENRPPWLVPGVGRSL